MNLNPPQTRVRLPSRFDDVTWHKIDYLGWRDLRAPLNAHLVIITARREGVRTRTIAFLRSVSDTERIVRRRD
ncbi:FBP domain-containing protein [Rhodococcus erythropolis]|uniref:FBP domain-containing protein n=1 Tax=Rhodococcus erythropolis TaxID=1833 RepID=UPI002AD56013|nr:FBP domain-containing protein [Rhodococcus erythropolis]